MRSCVELEINLKNNKMDLNETHKDEIAFLVKHADKNLPEVLRMFAKEYETEKLRIGGVSNWLACKDELPKHGETVLTYTPLTEIASEQVRLMKYGTLKSGFPSGITYWQRIDKPTCY